MHDPLGTRSPVARALALYAVWVAATYLLEGMPRTLLRPDATALRLAYALVANLGIGIAGSLWLLRCFAAEGTVSPRAAGFGGPGRAASAVAAGAALGFGFYLLQGPPSLDPVVVANGFAQTLVVTIAEILVCWAVAGAAIEAALRRRGTPLPALAAALAASLLFGVYHFAHSPPFDSVRVVAMLTGIGLLTSAFFLVARDVYGTIVLHNCFGLFGVLDALRRAGRLESYTQWIPPLLATAAVALLLLVALHRAWLRGVSAALSRGRVTGAPRFPP